jgi:hypothetical protein
MVFNDALNNISVISWQVIEVNILFTIKLVAVVVMIVW